MLITGSGYRHQICLCQETGNSGHRSRVLPTRLQSSARTDPSSCAPEEGHSSACRRRDLLSLTAGAALWLQSCRQAQALSADFTEPQPTKGLGNSAPGGSSAKFETLRDRTLAYEFIYPIEAGGRKISLVASRKPERYSSAPPLSADARQRIVAELVDFSDRATLSVTVGPQNGQLRKLTPDQWSAKDVASVVLADRSTGRLTTGQRTSISTVESASKEQRDGSTYWVYEHTAVGSPSIMNRENAPRRRAIAVTAMRPGLSGEPYLYTFNLSCPEDAWDVLGPLYEQAAQSFRLTATTKEYVPPDQDPWRFW